MAENEGYPKLTERIKLDEIGHPGSWIDVVTNFTSKAERALQKSNDANFVDTVKEHGIIDSFSIKGVTGELPGVIDDFPWDVVLYMFSALLEIWVKRREAVGEILRASRDKVNTTPGTAAK